MSCLLADFVVPHLCGRLRQVDIKAEHFERQVQRVEQERDTWTNKYEVCVTITGRCIRLVSHEVASLIVDPSRRKWKPNTASRKQSWTNSLRTWRVSDLRVLGSLTSLYRHAYPWRKLELSGSACRPVLILRLSYLTTEGYWLKNKMNYVRLPKNALHASNSP